MEDYKNNYMKNNLTVKLLQLTVAYCTARAVLTKRIDEITER